MGEMRDFLRSDFRTFWFIWNLICISSIRHHSEPFFSQIWHSYCHICCLFQTTSALLPVDLRAGVYRDECGVRHHHQRLRERALPAAHVYPVRAGQPHWGNVPRLQHLPLCLCLQDCQDGVITESLRGKSEDIYCSSILCIYIKVRRVLMSALVACWCLIIAPTGNHIKGKSTLVLMHLVL